jgi:hypothetical protein
MADYHPKDEKKPDYPIVRAVAPPGLSVPILGTNGEPTGQRQLFLGKEATANAHQAQKLAEFMNMRPHQDG